MFRAPPACSANSIRARRLPRVDRPAPGCRNHHGISRRSGVRPTAAANPAWRGESRHGSSSIAGRTRPLGRSLPVSLRSWRRDCQSWGPSWWTAVCVNRDGPVSGWLVRSIRSAAARCPRQHCGRPHAAGLTAPHRPALRRVRSRKTARGTDKCGPPGPAGPPARAGSAPPGVDVAAECLPAARVGGDFFDIVALPGERYAFLVGDVSGHGISAALLMGLIHGAMSSPPWGVAENEASRAAELNRLLVAKSSEERFASLFWCAFDPASASLRYLNAGHPPPLLIRRRDHMPAAIDRLTAGGPVLGVVEAAAYRVEQIRQFPATYRYCSPMGSSRRRMTPANSSVTTGFLPSPDNRSTCRRARWSTRFFRRSGRSRADGPIRRSDSTDCETPIARVVSI